MKITRITATRKIHFFTDAKAEGKLTLTCLSPAYGSEKIIHTTELKYKVGQYECERFIGECDLITSRFIVSDASGNEIEGKKYVEDINNSQRDYDYPTPGTKKGLQVVSVPDALHLGVKHAALNVNLGDFIMLRDEDGSAIEFTYNGKKYYFNKKIVEDNDKRIKDLSDNGMVITLIMLNSRKWVTMVSDELWSVISHPGYDGFEGEKGILSQFNMFTEEGIELYQAFVAFLVDRYTREDDKYGRAYGLIVGNEVNSAYTWCNAGLMECEEFCSQYTKVLRMTYQIASSIYKNMRTYISLDHFWTGRNYCGTPTKYYPAREVLERINAECLKEGQVGWNVAHHPYPENLAFPDFWNDETATNSPDTFRITFKNLELLAEFLYHDDMLFNGKRRRIILSEQGFNSNWTPESEVLQAVAYARAYKKVMQIPEIDSFILHAHIDNQYEFNLNLGLWRRQKDSGEIDAAKPMYHVFKAIDQKDDKGVYHWERY